MSRKLTYIIIGISCLTFGSLGLTLHKKAKFHETSSSSKREIIQTEKAQDNTSHKSAEKIAHTAHKSTETVANMAPKNAKKIADRVHTSANKLATVRKSPEHTPTARKVIMKSNNVALTKVSFEELPGWDTADVKKSLLAFQKSCETFLKQSPSHLISSGHIKLKAQDWHPACKAAVAVDSVSEDSAKAFFEKWFHPIEFTQKKPVKGLFTGYYMPKIKGNLTKSSKYSTPIYGLPKGKYSTSYTREQIDNGALRKKAPVIAWIHSPAERLFLEIEGSGVIQLPNGENIYLGYAGENGAPYTSIAKVMINKGIMSRHNASKAAIIRYLEQHPDKAKEIIQKNKSFVFFEDLKEPMALGAQGMALTPGYSLAVDKKWIPLGAPLWLDTKRPDKNDETNEKQFQRLMIAQDTGGAIRGFMRGDIYWGSGKFAAFLGEHMKNKGHYWLLLPKHILNRLAKKSL
ncbi:MltA domain-containing protein [Fluoribacter dumoffii]|uniref:peptidoglycan lytic exotransglycosylase n=1 Tax=Fluoribacter dumoffii TaxID=463 RepID=A0A377GD29_9GAMM|nr:MltA domain-containing protein [Fluoribacter dumoffii]KTC90926.1 membrane-bound lytic murein transglycosylase (MltA) family protein [Fluoribacter dumoffii NY 23]MCW8386495.1 MltA domain-containing protein [Fluoribacter dumoffii]MCW8419549.1 MltA domain-containing protein [Fluoribacter dumoffii]MCW8455748.1 MltA domain-containing protein [Fluoribacter dumoffii]MCW8460173.1 MltA domain-containing protein [Fluoribacter dumoffii]